MTESQSTDPRDEEQPPEDAEAALCPHCIEPIERFDHFCPHCGGPVTAHATMDPMGQIFASGYVYRRAVSADRPRFIVVLGMWLIFGPQLLPLIIFLLALGNRFVSATLSVPGGNSVDFRVESWGLTGLGVLVMLAFVVLYSTILWKVTRRYVLLRKRLAGCCPTCGCDLRGNAAATQCPECGHPLSRANRDAARDELEHG
ncbi:MAG: hypothetical protein WD042_00910 [Phycisphaeraceae bacterium]